MGNMLGQYWAATCCLYASGKAASKALAHGSDRSRSSSTSAPSDPANAVCIIIQVHPPCWPILLSRAGIVMYASAMCVRIGAASQAAFEVIRQLWVLSIQLFECLNVATQSMAAGFLGVGDRLAARALLLRATVLSVAVGAGVGVMLLVLQQPLVWVFTADPAVAQMCLGIIPMIALLMPVDAGASIADGGFIAAGQTNMLSAIQVHGKSCMLIRIMCFVPRAIFMTMCMCCVHAPCL